MRSTRKIEPRIKDQAKTEQKAIGLILIDRSFKKPSKEFPALTIELQGALTKERERDLQELIDKWLGKMGKSKSKVKSLAKKEDIFIG